MIANLHSIYSQSVHAPALDAGLMDNDTERYCSSIMLFVNITLHLPPPLPLCSVHVYNVYHNLNILAISL